MILIRRWKIPAFFEDFLQRAFVREAMDGADALRERFEQRVAPAAGGEGGRLLVRLLVGFGEESHRLIVPGDEFPHSDAKLDFSLRLTLLHREEMELRELLDRVALSQFPF